MRDRGPAARLEDGEAERHRDGAPARIADAHRAETPGMPVAREPQREGRADQAEI
jgi:hypothetical protein